MNLLQFLNQVDMIAMNETQENLAALIHDLVACSPRLKSPTTLFFGTVFANGTC